MGIWEYGSIGSCDDIAACRKQAITWDNVGLVYRRIISTFFSHLLILSTLHIAFLLPECGILCLKYLSFDTTLTEAFQPVAAQISFASCAATG